MLNGNETSPSISPAGRGQILKMLVTLFSHHVVCFDKIVLTYSFNIVGRLMRKARTKLAEKFDGRPTINSRTAITDTDCSSMCPPNLTPVPVGIACV